MCNYIKNNKEKCKLSPQLLYCHIHKKLIIKNNLKKEIINLNKTILKKVDKIKELEQNLEFFKNEVNELQKKYKTDYDKYQIIKQYEILKNQLININPDSSPYKILSDYYYKDIIKQKFNKDIDELKYEFNELRKKRIEYCHSIKSMV
jgi:cell division protein FtsB